MMYNEVRNPIICNDKNYMMLFGEHEQIKVTFIEVIGAGGTCIVYKCEREENDIKRTCIVKEYYPEFTAPDIHYKRTETGTLCIEADGTLEQQAERIEAEKKVQKMNIEREYQVNQALFYSDTEKENSPYVYLMDYVKVVGDSTYVILDTTKGKTLKTVITHNGNRGIGLEKALLYTRKLLEIIRWMNREKEYVHGDITPQNLWVTGENENISLKLLDFGSAFKKRTYEMDEEDLILEYARQILYNEGIGSSTEGFRSIDIMNLWEAKQEFCNMPSNVTRAKKLLECVNIVSTEKTDIHAALKIFYYLMTGRTYNGIHGITDIAKFIETDRNDVIVKKLLDLMLNNSKMHYETIESAMAELDSFEDILLGNCTPEVLLQEIKKEIKRQPFNVDKKLFAPISYRKDN